MFSFQHIHNTMPTIPDRWACVKTIAALVLLAAAVMKTVQLATVPVLGEGLFHSRWFEFCLIEFELGFALWLLADPFPTLTRLAVIALFSAFGLFSLYKAISGEVSCGCFGAAKVDPRFTASLDAALVILAICSRPGTDGVSLSVRKITLAAAIWAACSIPVIAAAVSTRTSSLASLGRVHISSNGRRTIELEPDKWTGGAIPILSFIEPTDVRRRLSEGSWTVLFFQHDCRECQKEIQSLAALDTPDIVCVEIPPYGEDSCIPEHLVHARLTDQYAWYIETPMLLRTMRLN